ncbi:hypothetical protein M0R79_03360 [Ignavigranum ruoffiae]|nr:hypothetical protein [Ignavigranum ruoffiae]UPQ86423.1 hypothetical protein M0R79_03360 [Ignavigranum ruoffiae]
MAKYKVLKPIRDKETKKMYEVGEIIEVTVKRFEESNKKYPDHLERVDKE